MRCISVMDFDPAWLDDLGDPISVEQVLLFMRPTARLCHMSAVTITFAVLRETPLGCFPNSLSKIDLQEINNRSLPVFSRLVVVAQQEATATTTCT